MVTMSRVEANPVK